MKRRELLVGIGGLTAASLSAVGAGAFSSIEAGRRISINVDTDQYAYLELNPNSANFSKLHDGLLVFEFDEKVTPDDGGTYEDTGDGPGADSEYEFTDLFQIRNQGTNDIVVFGEYDDDDALEDVELVEKGRIKPLTKANPSSVVPSPGGDISIGLRVTVGDILPQEINTTVKIIAVSQNSERYPSVFPDGDNN